MQTAFIRNIPGSSVGEFFDLLKTFPDFISCIDFSEKISPNKMVFCKFSSSSFSKFKKFIEENFPGSEVQEGDRL